MAKSKSAKKKTSPKKTATKLASKSSPKKAVKKAAKKVANKSAPKKAGNREYHASAVIVTAPAGVLRKGSIRFPSLMRNRIATLDGIGTGEVIRFVLVFPRPYWPEDTMFLFSDEAVPTWWPSTAGQQFQIVGWAGSAKARAMAGMHDNQKLDNAFSSLSRILGVAATELQQAVSYQSVTDWSLNKWAGGGYSYATPATGEARAALNGDYPEPVWFAGESYADVDHPGTVESAMVHAREIAAKVVYRLVR